MSEDVNPGWLRVVIVGAGMLSLLALLVALARADAVTTTLSFTDSVNVSVSNSSMHVTADNITYSYALSNVSQTLTFPVVVMEDFRLFNVSVAADNFSCESLLNSSFANQTAYLEMVIREQLVPSQAQYIAVELEKNNITAQCILGKNILSNEILNHKLLLNASAINFNASMTLMSERVDKLRGELRTSNLVAVGLGVLTFLLALIIITGRLPPQWWDEFINQLPGGTARAGMEVKKQKPGDGKRGVF